MSAPGWLGRRVVDNRRTVDFARSLVEGADHATDRLVEHYADGGLQDAAAELEVDEERDLAALRVGVELPLVIQVAERALFVAHFDPLWPIEGNQAREGFAKWAKADGEVGHQLARRAATDAGGDTPGQELRVFAHIRHQVEELVRTVGDNL